MGFVKQRRGDAPERALRTGEIRVRAFRAADEFVVEAFRASTSLAGGPGEELAREMRLAVVRVGALLVAASAHVPKTDPERRCLEEARVGLIESRYYLYLARRFSLLEARAYRGLMSRHEAAQREVEAALRPRRGPAVRDPP